MIFSMPVEFGTWVGAGGKFEGHGKYVTLKFVKKLLIGSRKGYKCCTEFF